MRTAQMLKPNRMLRVADIGAGELRVAIAAVTLEQFGARASESGLVLSFDCTDRVLLLDLPAIARLSAVFGTDSRDWIGRSVIVFVDAATLRLRPASRYLVQPPQVGMRLEPAAFRGQVA